MTKFNTCGLEFTDDSGKAGTEKGLKEFRKKVSDLMNKYKVFYVQTGLNPFSVRKK